jgi:hypothetical protein
MSIDRSPAIPGVGAALVAASCILTGLEEQVSEIRHFKEISRLALAEPR